MHFDLVDLRLFVHIADTRSVTRGAGRAHLSVPAASIRVKNLEESVGAKLLLPSYARELAELLQADAG